MPKNNNLEDKIFCTYLLINPIDNLPFYVGEGIYPQRPNSHWRDFTLFKLKNKRRSVLRNNLKYSVLCQIYELGLEPVVKIFVKNVNKNQSLKIELLLINKYGLKIDGTGCLTNLTKDQTISPMLLEHNKIKCSEVLKTKYSTAEGKSEIQKQSNSRKLFYQTTKGEQVKELLSTMAKKLVGDKNPNYGNKWNEEQKNNLKEIKLIQNKGESNPMFGKIRITNGTENKTILKSEKLPKGWRLGMSDLTKQKRKNQINAMSGKVRINNGIINTIIKIGEQLPKGFVLGMIKRK